MTSWMLVYIREKMKTMSPKWKDFQNLLSGMSKFTETYIWVSLVRR